MDAGLDWRGIDHEESRAAAAAVPGTNSRTRREEGTTTCWFVAWFGTRLSESVRLLEKTAVKWKNAIDIWCCQRKPQPIARNNTIKSIGGRPISAGRSGHDHSGPWSFLPSADDRTDRPRKESDPGKSDQQPSG
jgi:hypothetical protein